MEIETSSKAPTTPSMVQPIAISPQRGGIGLDIIPLLI
jgi:hypothetical protein